MEDGVHYAPWEKSLNRILTPLEMFIHRQTTSGVLLMICAVVALIIANSPLYEYYEQINHIKLAIKIGDFEYYLTLHHWINEALMAFFFLLMGLELKREFLVGELSAPSQALLPIMAAIGGMFVPAAFYFFFNQSGQSANGWGIPMATDIAFAIGALSLLGARVPKSLVTFLIALAIVDDLGAVAVIAFFYTNTINMEALGLAGAFCVLLGVLNLGGVRSATPYVLIGMLLWTAMLASGVHATIAGILLAAFIPIKPKFDLEFFIEKVHATLGKIRLVAEKNPDIVHNEELRGTVSALSDGVMKVQAPAQRAEHLLHLPVAYLVIPIFALANAGVPIEFGEFTSYFSDPIMLGVLAGLVLGKPVGIVGITWLTTKITGSKLPEGLNFYHILGVGFLGGIGFTMSIFVADLGFAGFPEDLLMAKTAILFASAIAGLTGFILLLLKTESVN